MENIKSLLLKDLKNNLETFSPKKTGYLASNYVQKENGISNDTPYLKYVNDGTAYQAGQHFIEKSIIKTKSDFKKIVNDAKRKEK